MLAYAYTNVKGNLIQPHTEALLLCIALRCQPSVLSRSCSASKERNDTWPSISCMHAGSMLNECFSPLSDPCWPVQVGIIGSLGFWPMSVHFPTEMHIAQRRLPASSAKAIGLRCFSACFLIIAIAGIIGNVYGVKVDTEGYRAFGNGYVG